MAQLVRKTIVFLILLFLQKVISPKPREQESFLMIGLHRGQKLNTKFIVSNFSDTSGISRQKSWDIPPNNLVSLGFEGHAELFGPHPSRGRPPTHPKNSGPKSLGMGSFSLMIGYEPACFFDQRPLHTKLSHSQPLELVAEFWLSLGFSLKGSSAIFSQSQPLSRWVFSQHAAIVSHLQPRFSHFQPRFGQNSAIFLPASLKMAEKWVKTAEFCLKRLKFGWVLPENGWIAEIWLNVGRKRLKMFSQIWWIFSRHLVHSHVSPETETTRKREEKRTFNNYITCVAKLLQTDINNFRITWDTLELILGLQIQIWPYWFRS